MESFDELKAEGAIELCIMKTQGDMILDKALRAPVRSPGSAARGSRE